MIREIDISSLDLRYENYRMRDAAQEARLLTSMCARGIEEPLEGVDTQNGSILLNGFKRLRCARKLGFGTAPYVSLGADEAMGIIRLLRVSNDTSLAIIEQAKFLEELKQLHRMSVSEIAEKLSRSKAWVSMRVGLVAEMGETMRRRIVGGEFPVYSYMYTLRPFMRMNGIGRDLIEQFVTAVSGKKLSVRDIELLANGFFKGPESLRQEIGAGNLELPLRRLKHASADAAGCSEFERVLLNDLELLHKYLLRVMGKSADARLKSRAFQALAHLATAGILSRTEAFIDSMRCLHDRCGEK